MEWSNMQSSNTCSLILFSRPMSRYHLDLFQYLVATIHNFCSSSIQKGKNVSLHQPKAIDHNFIQRRQQVWKGYSFKKTYMCVCGKETVVNL